MKVLVDTSVWSAALRRDVPANTNIVRELQHLISDHLVKIIGPIRQELLSGIRDASHFGRLTNHLAAFPDIELTTEDYVVAAKFFNLCRTKGIQGSNTDFLICAVAVRNDLAIFTTDKDFLQFAKYLPIVLHKASLQEKATQ
ncbi:MAG: PIN domain-containing protein [Kiritimatiellia bacterium]